MGFKLKDLSTKALNDPRMKIQGISKAEPKPISVTPVPHDRYKSDWERQYAEHLERRRLAGEITWWEYETIKIKLADKTWYKVDFALIPRGEPMEFHEVKGWMREAARVRLNVAAWIFPAKFVVVRKTNGGWNYETKAGK
jgi:hypothetical protein